MGTLTLENLVVGYRSRRGAGGGHNAPLSLTFAEGQVACLIGPNGIGKSTLLRTMAGFQPPLSGRVLIDGADMAHLSKSQMARRVGVVMAAMPSLPDLTAAEVVGMGRQPYTNFWGTLTASDRRAVDEAMTLTGTLALAGRRFARLSDGERQKVVVAKALAQQTPVVLLDEPTAFLDHRSKAALLQLLARLAHEAQKTIVVSTHDVELARQHADRFCLLYPTAGSGFALVEGTPRQVAASEQYARFV